MRILVSGRRNNLIGVEETLDRFVDAYIGDRDYTKDATNGHRHIFIQGGAKGVDKQVAQWAFEKQLIYITHPAEWGRYGGQKVAGHFRNTEMLRMWRPNWLIAFLTPDSKGTRNMLDQATNKSMRDSLALNILLVKYSKEDAAPIEIQESLYGLRTDKLEWGDFIKAPF